LPTASLPDAQPMVINSENAITIANKTVVIFFIIVFSFLGIA